MEKDSDLLNKKKTIIFKSGNYVKNNLVYIHIFPYKLTTLNLKILLFSFSQ